MSENIAVVRLTKIQMYINRQHREIRFDNVFWNYMYIA